jgi:hypothetical protein
MDKNNTVRCISVLLIIFFIFENSSYGQQIITLNAPENTVSDHIATEKVNFLPNYSNRNPSTNIYYSMHAAIDATSPRARSPVSYNTPLDKATLANRTINTALAVGKTNSSLDISGKGASTYHIPIALPLGTNGFVPKLSINYNSLNSKRLLGKGWNLNGLSQIYWSFKNRYLDGESGTIELTANDVFELDGNRLVGLSGTYGTNGAIYGTERETFYRITSLGTQGTGPDWFKVETKDGSTVEYGRTSDAEYVHSSQTTVGSWMINKSYDQYGNQTTYHYRTVNNEVLLHKIVYQATEVIFHYASRADKNKFYFGDVPFSEGHLITSIEVFTENRQVKKYAFEYSKEVQSLLNAVKEFGSDGSELNSLMFHYGSKGIKLKSWGISYLGKNMS